MADYTTWRRSAFENNRRAPDGWPQFNLPRTVNDTGREMQSAMARRRARFGDYPTSTGGEANVYQVELPSLTLTEIPAGFRVGFTAHQSSIASDASFQVNDIAAATLYGSEDTGISEADIVAGRRYDLVYTESGWEILFLRPTDNAGQIDLSAIPSGFDAGSLNGFALSTAATGADADTIYFRTSNGGEIYHGSTRVESIIGGGGIDGEGVDHSEPIRNVLVGGDVVYAHARPVTDLAATLVDGATITLTWTAPSVSSQPFAYRVQRSTSADFSTLDSDDTTTAETITYTGTVGALTYFRVRTENYIGDSIYVSDFVSAVVPGAPNLANATFTESGFVGTVTLLFVAPSVGTLPFIYDVRWRRLTGSFGLLSAILSDVTVYNSGPINQFGTIDDTLSDLPGRAAAVYAYSVRARNDIGTGPWSNELQVNVF